MLSLRFSSVLAIGSLSAMLGACGGVTVDSTGDGGGGQGGGDGGGGHQPTGACTVTPVDHAAACPEPCAITVDVEADCDDYHFGSPGVRVAPAPDTTWILTSSESDRMLFRANAEGGVRADEGLPLELSRLSMELALAPDGALHIAADITQAPNYEKGVIHLVEKGGAWTVSEVFDVPNKFMPVAGFEVASDGVPHLWIVGATSETVHHATQEASGAWNVGAGESLKGAEQWGFTLTNDGQPAALSHVGKGSDWQLRTRIGGVEQALGSPHVGDFPLHYPAIAHPPVPAAPAGSPSLAVVQQYADGLRLAWPDGASFKEVVFPDTALLKLTCDASADDCSGDCHEVAQGVERGAFDVARTADGTIWVAYSTTSTDTQGHFESSCGNEDCPCYYTIDQDDSTAVLHLFRVPVDGGAPKEVLTLPTVQVDAANVFQGYYDEGRAIDMRTFGNDLTIGLVTAVPFAPSGERPDKVRAIRIDTSKLAP